MHKWFVGRPSFDYIDCELACVVTDMPSAPSSLYEGTQLTLDQNICFFFSVFLCCGHYNCMWFHVFSLRGFDMRLVPG